MNGELQDMRTKKSGVGRCGAVARAGAVVPELESVDAAPLQSLGCGMLVRHENRKEERAYAVGQIPMQQACAAVEVLRQPPEVLTAPVPNLIEIEPLQQTGGCAGHGEVGLCEVEPDVS